MMKSKPEHIVALQYPSLATFKMGEMGLVKRVAKLLRKTFVPLAHDDLLDEIHVVEVQANQSPEDATQFSCAAATSFRKRFGAEACQPSFIQRRAFSKSSLRASSSESSSLRSAIRQASKNSRTASG